MKMHQPLNGFDRRPVVQGERFYSASGRRVATPSRLISRELLLPIKLSIMRQGGKKEKEKKTIMEKLIKPREIKLDGR